jgi:hypothetical protein
MQDNCTCCCCYCCMAGQCRLPLPLGRHAWQQMRLSCLLQPIQATHCECSACCNSVPEVGHILCQCFCRHYHPHIL